MQALRKQLKEKKVEGIYLLYGEEQFMLQSYVDVMVNIVFGQGDTSMNLDVFNEDSDIGRVTDAIRTLPFLAEKRMVILKSPQFFKPKFSKKREGLVEGLQNVPDTTVFVLITEEVDKRQKLYKTINKLGQVAEFKQLSIEDLVKHVARRLSKVDKKIETKTAHYLIEVVGHELRVLNNEIDKLIDYTGEHNIIYAHDIDEIATESIENRIFELVDSIGNRRKERALKLFEDLIFLKEPPTRILYMITRQFRILLQIKLLMQKNYNNKEIASKIKQPPFVVTKCSKQVNYFSVAQLKKAMNDCLHLESDFKHGKIEIIVGIEMLISDYSR